MKISRSRFTPDVNPEDVYFSIGDTVKYKLKDDTVIDIKIDSELMRHDQAESYGYESIFSDDKKRYFAESERIIDWEGKN